MSLKKKINTLLLLGAAAGTVLFGCRVNKNTKNKTEKTNVIHTIEKANYRIHAGVLMPLPNETQESYEQRRIRLEQSENRLKKKLAENILSQIKQAPKTAPSDFKHIERLEERLKELNKETHYLSYYTPEGQKKLKSHNTSKKIIPDKQEAVSGKKHSTSSEIRAGKAFDF